MRNLLAPLGMVYALIHGIRRKLYLWGVLRAQRLSKPVISVGNLTVGGTGKTPFIDILLNQFEALNLKCCVLTRGYGRENSSFKIVSHESSVEEVGDEPLWLFKRHPNVIISVGADRLAAAKLAGPVDLYLLDDGLQHLSLHRDFEITLIDATRPLWHFHPLPWGYGRDSVRVLKRSDLIVLTRSNQATPDQLDKIAVKIFDQGFLDVIEGFVGFEEFKNIISDTVVEVKPQKVGLVSAVGNPHSFEKLAKEIGFEVVFHETKRDHWSYSQNDIEDLEKKALANGVQMILTTEKDSVKLRGVLSSTKTTLVWITLVAKMTFDPELPNIYDLVSHSSH